MGGAVGLWTVAVNRHDWRDGVECLHLRRVDKTFSLGAVLRTKIIDGLSGQFGSASTRPV